MTDGISKNGKTTRRQLISGLASFSISMFAFPFTSRPATAAPNRSGNATRMMAAVFFESYATIALRRALRYAGEDGFVASMPQLLHARTIASYDNIIWNTWFTSNSEESMLKTPRGNRVVVAVHGGGIFASPERFERSYHTDLNRSNPEGLTGQSAAKISRAEARDVLNGKLPDGTEIPMYWFDEIKRGIADLPMRYGVILTSRWPENRPVDTKRSKS